ncbi:MAG: hypothetical protein Q9191_001822 [Dirinaria sp. TL-2023a]
MDQGQVNGKTRTDQSSIQAILREGFVGIAPGDKAWENTERPRERTQALYNKTLSTAPPTARSSKSLIYDLSSRRSAESSPAEPPHTPLDIDEDGRDMSHGPWLTNDLRKKVPQARILLYHHGELEEGTTIQTLADRLLENLRQARKIEFKTESSDSFCRPIFFICHSTGGLVAKKALNIANEEGALTPIADDCHGMTFIATPHQGSAYLSSKEFWPSIREVMRLHSVIPDSLQRQLRFESPELLDMAEKFKKYSTDLRITTYYETTDSDLAFTPANDDGPRSYHVPIVSVASAIMELEHESEIPLSSDHVGCATFIGDTEAQETFISELEVAARSAATLSKVKHYSIDLEEEVRVEVNGFFEDNTSSVKLWTARPSLADFLKSSPKELLKDRLKQSKELIKAPAAKKDTQSNKGKEISALTVAEEPKLKPPEKLRGKYGNAPRNKQMLQRPAPLIKSMSSSRLAKDPGNEQNNGSRLETQKTAPDDTSTVATEGRSVPIITFSPENPLKEPRRHSIAPADPGPQLPAMNRLKLTWVHIPYTHPGWVPSVLDRFFQGTEANPYSEFLKEEHWASNHNHGRHAAPHAKYVNSTFINPSKESNKFAVYLQYLHWDTYRQLLVRRLTIRRRMNQRRVRPIREDIKDSKSLEAKMIWKYLGAEPPFHCRRTLDQFGYPNLRSCEARDDDQMIWKRTKPKAKISARSSKKTGSSTHEPYDFTSSTDFEKKHSAHHSPFDREEDDNDESLQKKLEEIKNSTQEGNVLMVDQLWLWALDDKTIVTFFPRKEGFASEGRLSQQGDLHNDIYNEVNSGLTVVPDAHMFAALIVQRAVTILLDRTAHRHLQVLRIYEESLSILIERMTRSYKSFRKEGFSVRPDAYYRKQNGEPMTTGEKQEKDLSVERQSKEDFSSLLELRDISDELHTIKKLFQEQRDALVDMAVHYLDAEGTGEKQNAEQDRKIFIQRAREAQKHSANGLDNLVKAERSLNSFERSVSDMIESAENTEKAYSNLLDIKQKQASVDESRLARAQMDATAAQGRAIMVFTLFTIIFLPLSFFTSVFGMNVREWSDPNQPPALRRIVYFIGPISVGVIFIALTLAFSISIRAFAVAARKIVVGVSHDLYHLISQPLSKASRPAHTMYERTRIPLLLDGIADRYLRHKDQDFGNDHGIWNSYALPQHKSARDVTYGNARTSSSRRRSFFKYFDKV